METCFLKRPQYVTDDAIAILKEKTKEYMLGKIQLEEIDLLVKDATKMSRKEEQKIDSFSFFKAILNIGELIERKIDISKINIEKGINSSDYYDYCIKEAMKDNIEEVSTKVSDFFSVYGFFVPQYKETLNLLYFIRFCYLIFETIYLFSCFTENTDVKLKPFISYYYSDLTFIISENPTREKILKTIEKNVNFLQEKNNYVRFKIKRDIVNNTNESYFNNRYNVETIFTSPLALAVYELKMQLSRNTENSIAICKNTDCLRPFEQKSKKQLYCNNDNLECVQGRYKQRQQKCAKNRKNAIK